MRKLSTDLIKSGSFTGSFSGSVTGLINSASYALTASTVLNAFSLTTGSTYSITASWGNYSISSSFSNTSTSSSYANTASNLSPVAQDLIPSVDSLYNLGSITNKWKDLYVSTGSIYIGNVSLNTSGSTLFANVQPIVTLNTASGQIEVSGITASLSSSFATNAGTINNTSSTVFATTGSNLFNGNQTVQGDVRVVGNLIAEQYIVSSSVSYFTSSTFDGSTKFGDSSQDTHQFTGSVLAPNITGSLLGSSSYAETSSLALIALTSSYINVATNAVSSSYAATASISFTTVSSSFSNTSSLANTASYVLNSVSSSFASTSSYSLNSVSSSYSNVANTATSASYSLSASYAPGGGTTLTTGSTYPITSSWSTNAISSSFATFAVSATSATSATSANTATSASYSLSSSYSVNSTTATSSSFASTSSYNLNSISSSFSNNALTASYVENSVSSSYALTASFSLNGGGGGTTLTTGSTYPITSSWANNVITASYALVAGSGGGSTPVVSVASLNNQTILYNFSSSQEATITGLTLTNNNWGINVVEEWNSGSGDIYYPSCSLLCHFDSINSAGRFIDNSSNNFTITSSGGAGLSTSQYKFGGASAYFDGIADSLFINYNSALNLSSDFTIELWFYPITSSIGNILNFAGLASVSYASYGIINNTDGINFAASSANTSYDIGSETGATGRIGTVSLNTWNHIAVTRQGNVYRGFVNGVQGYTQTLSLTPYNPNARGLAIGSTCTGSWGVTPLNSINGYLDELRITKGIARYTGSFTTQSLAFPNSTTQTATKYIGLVGGLNDTNVDYGIEKLSDSSLKIKKLTDTQQPSGSFLSSSVDRVYVNVLNYSNISVGSTLLGQAFTAVGSTSSYALSRSVVNPYEIIVAVDGAVQSFNDAYSVTSSTINFTENIPSGSLVDIRYLTTPNVNSASYALTASYALNGGSGGGSVSTGSIVNQTILYNVTTSQDNTITGLNLTGNKWDISVIEEWNSGSVVVDQYYNSCSLLMHFSGSNNSTVFIDDSPITKSFTVNGDSKISTAQSKFGSSSAYFDGTGDYLSTNSSNDFAFGTGDFTIECWFYSSNVGSKGLFQTSDTVGGLKTSYTSGIILLQGANNVGAGLSGGLCAAVTGTFLGSTTAVITTNTWYHIALVRYSGTSTIYLNGTSIGSASTTGNCSGTYLAIGGYYDTSYLYQGYMDEVRITKGVARYTGSFPVPTTEFIVSLPQYATKYIGLIGGLNDSAVDYGIEKLSDSSLKIRKMTASGQPLSGSGALSASVDRVYVNVLNYENAVITGSISNAVSASFAFTSSFAQTTPSGKSIALSFILG